MFKSYFVIGLLGFSALAFAADDEVDPFSVGTAALGTPTTAQPVSTKFTYETVDKDDRSKRKFVKTPFDFTLSANVVAGAGEDTDSRFMIVATGNENGRNFYVGHSNGGSVTSCGDPLTSDDVKSKKKPYETLKARVIFTKEDGCDPSK